MNALKYRPDIDGLRAIAVVMVVLFHADFNGFKGGFIGVDVFFVISGYLITSLIFEDLKADRFSLLHFWERRIRRILPALAAVVFATLAVGALIFFPSDFMGLAGQVKWQSITASNFYFLGQRGYFNTQHELEPLLHTWSLAVEEQFYLLFPIIFFLCWRFARNRTVLIFWLGALLSLALSIWMVAKSADKAFFLLPFRAWELLLGSLLVLHMPYLQSLPQRIRNAGGIAGIAMVVASGMLFDPKMDFPGFSALLPCLGAAMIIWSGAGRDTPVYRMLSLKYVVFVGLISYSWYLWHWPAFSFAEYVLQNEYKKPEKIVCIVASFGLAILSWKYVETPFRRPGGVLKTRRTVFIAAFAVLASMAAAGFIIKERKGFPERFSEEVYVYSQGKIDQNPMRKFCDKDKYERILKDDVCQSNPESGKKPVFMLWGDSQADAIAPAFATLSKKHNVNGYLAFKHGCPPILDIRHGKNDGGRPFCADYNKAHFDFIKRHKIKYVYLVANWTSWVKNKDLYFDERGWYAPYEDRYENILMAGVQRTVDDLQKMGVTVYFLVNTPSMDFEPPRALALETILHVQDSRAYQPLEHYMKARAQDLDGFIKKNKGSKMVVTDTMPMLCKDKKCISALNGRSLYFDKGHVSAYGANYLIPVFEPFFDRID